MQFQFRADTDSATAFANNLAKAGNVDLSDRGGKFESKSVSANFLFVPYNGLLFVTVTRHPKLAKEDTMYAFFSKFFS